VLELLKLDELALLEDRLLEDELEELLKLELMLELDIGAAELTAGGVVPPPPPPPHAVSNAIRGILRSLLLARINGLVIT
jgi:hypothetical protein